MSCGSVKVSRTWMGSLLGADQTGAQLSPEQLVPAGKYAREIEIPCANAGALAAGRLAVSRAL